MLPRTPARLVVLVSGGGSNLRALLEACADPAYGAEVVAVGADRAGTGGVERAAESDIPTFVVAVRDFATRADWDRALTDACAAHQPDLVVSAGFLKLVGPAFLAEFGGRYVNTHNALLPAFAGIHGPRDALAYGVKVTGATLHFVDAGVDTGPIIAQVAVPVRDADTEESLTERIKEAERRQLVEYVGRLVREGWRIEGRKVLMGSSSDGRRPIRRALISVYAKTGLDDLVRALGAAGVEIVSTGSTAARIAAAGVPVTPVEELTGFPECLDGRVKTLHPAVHAGLLADLRLPAHAAQLGELKVAPFDLLVSNLYPFRETVSSKASPDECVEQIDIGGPAMVRAAAKNFPSVGVVTAPSQYADVLAALQVGGFTLDERRRLAARAFAMVADYDVAVAEWFARDGAGFADSADFPAFAGTALDLAAPLRYGENPHQRAALYRDPAAAPGLAQATQLHGREMSYNNYVDADAAWRAANDFAAPAVAIIKHANPCGIAVGVDVADAHRKAHACDPVSAFGGVIAVNRPVTVELAKQVADVFTEVVVAPSFADAAVEVLSAKKNIRLLQAPAWVPAVIEWRQVGGGVLVQAADRIDAPGDDASAWTLAAGPALDEATLADLVFAWRAVRSVKSNAILLASAGAAVGVGMGQVNRVDSARLAVARAGNRAAGSVAASDAFFPFADGLTVLLDAGVRAVVQPGGSMRDAEVVAAAQAAGATMYLTGTRHFFH